MLPQGPTPAHLVQVAKTGPPKHQVALSHGLLGSVQLWLLGLIMVFRGCVARLWGLCCSDFPRWHPLTTQS